MVSKKAKIKDPVFKPLLIVDTSVYEDPTVFNLAQSVFESYAHTNCSEAQRIVLPDMCDWSDMDKLHTYIEAINSALGDKAKTSGSDLIVLMCPCWQTSFLGDMMFKICKTNPRIHVIDGNNECCIPFNILHDIEVLKEVTIIGNMLLDLSDYTEPKGSAINMFYGKLGEFESLDSLTIMKALSYGRNNLPDWFTGYITQLEGVSGSSAQDLP